MKKYFSFLLQFFAGSSFSQQLRITDRLQAKLQFLNPLEYTRVLILLNDQVDIESLDKELYRINAPLNYRAQTVINTLKQKALQTQGPILQYLNSEKDRGKVNELMDFWVTNVIYAEVTPDVVLNLSTRTDVQMIDLDEKITWDKPIYDEPLPANNSTESVETGLKVIKADELWRLGFTGAGRTVMHIDTGVDGLHPALASRWWGNNGRPWQHAWFDPVSPFTTSPTDCGTHGTHTMGIMCGRNSASGDTVGVAPDAYWMSAGITDCPGASYPSMNIAAYQWAMDPDSNSVTMDMPDAISCSWQDPNVSGIAQCTSIYVSTLNAVEAAGIAVCFSAGNSGSGASTITPPKNINTDSVNVFSVGAVDGNTVGYPIASFSSRGPSICGGSGTLLIKPEVSAPGVNVRSLVPGNSYGLNSGTSMASPHVAGAIALLKQAAPGLTGKQIKAILFSTCTDLGTPGEDNTYGKGLINLLAAFQQLGLYPLNAFSIQTPAPGATIVSFPNSSTPVTITWDTAATGAQYKWIFGPAANPRLLTVPSSTNSITMTLGQLDVLLANAGVAQGSSLAGQWDVWSYRVSPVDSLKSSNGPRALTLTRGVPALSGFGLNSPPSGVTVTTSAFNSSLININWRKSGEGVTYKWKFGSPALSNVRLSVPSTTRAMTHH
ncbi:MAG: S8 family serine peptidase [Ignavibacteria bacterium]|nr:S8 family serine peptidase [Ignavibacteria bacterium]